MFWSMQERYDLSNPYDWLKKYKTTTTPNQCRICKVRAYYVHPTLGDLCAPHLLDLVNVGEMNWKWSDWEDAWNMTTRLLGSRSTTANQANMILRRLALIAGVLAGSKQCPACYQDKPIEEFSVDNARPDGYCRLCKQCDNARRRARFHRKKNR